MRIVFFAHPTFLSHQSMPRFARMLAEGMSSRGYQVEIWMPQPSFFNLPLLGGFKKWMSYLDQYILFPEEVHKKLKKEPQDTLFIFTDHALGPWVPLVSDRPHVIHCHDFLAQRSALGQIPENATSWSGKLYQQFIRRGYTKGKNFISVSYKTQQDLHALLPGKPKLSEVIYNGLNQSFNPVDPEKARQDFGLKTGIYLKNGFILHVGGNQWYKNRLGVMELYIAWRSRGGKEIPLLLVGEEPDINLLHLKEQTDFKGDIHFLSGLEDHLVRMAYCGASVFVFPSLAEGFGWPIAEAMASGCPVLTTNEAPMTEVAGEAGILIARRPYNKILLPEWAAESAQILNKIINLTPSERNSLIEAGLKNAKRFDADNALNAIAKIYHKVLQDYKSKSKF